MSNTHTNKAMETATKTMMDTADTEPMIVRSMQYDIDMSSARLKDEIDSLIRKLDETKDRIDRSPQLLNSLGELQGRGSRIDTFIGSLTAKIGALDSVKHHLAETDERTCDLCAAADHAASDCMDAS